MAENVIILGAGPAGYTAAIYAARANLTPLLIAGNQPGGQLTITTDVENFPGFPDGIAGPKLMEEMRIQAEKFGTRIVFDAVKSVDLKKKPFTVQTSDKKYEAKSVIVATGASAQWLGLEAEMQLMGKGVSGCATCDGFFFKNQEVVVVGGGDTALEEAAFLTRFAKKVTVVHRRDQFRASKIMQDKARSNKKIEFALSKIVLDILDMKQGKVTAVKLKDVKTGDTTELKCDGVFIAIGHKPNTEMFKGQIDMDDKGYIKTKKATMETNVAGVFAAGDVQDSYYRQAITAAGSGCMAAMDVEKYLCGA